MSDQSPRPTPAAGSSNRLGLETSPYLLQHANDPVDWWPWTPEPLALARGSDRPIFLSIGYSACHWCHVMARESFADPAIARLLSPFVAIKVDREELPEVDALYIDAVRELSEIRVAARSLDSARRCKAEMQGDVRARLVAMPTPDAAIEDGMITLEESARRRVLDHTTSLDELHRTMIDKSLT